MTWGDFKVLGLIAAHWNVVPAPRVKGAAGGHTERIRNHAFNGFQSCLRALPEAGHAAKECLRIRVLGAQE